MATSRAGGAAAPPRRAAPARPPLQQAAFVLQRHDWSESSLVVELFVRALGRVVTVARGAKKPTSNFRALLLPFAPVSVVLGRPAAAQRAGDDGTGIDLLPLKSAEWAGGQPLVRGAALFSAFYLNELLLRGLARQDPHPALFDAYAAALALLGGGADEAPVLRAVELVLLRETGLLPDLAVSTLDAAALAPASRYTLDARAGLVPAAEGGMAGERWTAIEAALADGRFAPLHAACRGTAGALRGPLRELLHYHLGHTPLRTREVWQGVQKLTETPR